MYMEISDLLLSQTDNYPQLQRSSGRTGERYRTAALRYFDNRSEWRVAHAETAGLPSLCDANCSLAGQSCGSVPAGLPDFRLHPQLSGGRTAPAE